MGKIPVDISAAGLFAEASYMGTIQKVEYQKKTGDKWNKDGTSTISFDEFVSLPMDNMKRARVTIAVDGKQNIWHDLYMGETSQGFVKEILDAARVTYDKSGYDLEELLNKSVGIKATIVEEAGYAAKNVFRFYKV
jgi:hypothetical protein